MSSKQVVSVVLDAEETRMREQSPPVTGFRRRAKAKNSWREMRKASRLEKEAALKRQADNLIY